MASSATAALFAIPRVSAIPKGLSIPDLFLSRFRRSVRQAIWKSLPALIAGGVVFAAVSAMDAPTADYGGGRSIDYLRTQFFVWLHYGRLFFLPMGLTADTDWKVIPHWYDTRVIAGLLFVALLLRTLWSSSTVNRGRYTDRWWSTVARRRLLPTSSIIPLAEVSNEHRVFFPYMGLSLAVVWGAALLVERWSIARPSVRPMLTRAAAVLALVAVGGNAVGTCERNKVYLTEESPWRDVTEKSPANGRGLMNYGLTQMARGRLEEAKELFDRALVYNPNYPTLEINLGIVTDRLGQQDVAEAHFARALQLAPDAPGSHFFFARWLAEQGRATSAVPHLRRAIELSPADTAARHLLLDTYAKTGQTAELKALVADTLRLAPGDPRATRYLNDQGEVVLPAPQPPPAPGVETAESLLNTSLRLYQARDFQGSIDAARRALKIRPGYAEAYNNIAAGLASLGRWDEAIEEAREALRLKPDFPLARNNLAWAEAEKQKAGK